MSRPVIRSLGGPRATDVIAMTVGAGCLLVLGVLARRSGSLPYLVGGVLVLVDLVLVRWSRPGPGHSLENPHRVVVLLAACWIVIAFEPLHDFDPQSTRAALSGVTLQTGSELLLFGLIGVFAAFLLRSYLPLVPPGAALSILPLWVLTSAVWADASLYAFARGLEYLAMAALAAATAGVASRGRDALEELATLFLRWTTRLTLTLIVLGVVFGPLFVLETASNTDRFTWIGAHPTESGFLLGASLLVLVSTNSERLRVPPTLRVIFVIATGVALYQNQTRTVLAGLLVGGSLLLVLHGRRQPDVAAVSGFFAIGGSIVAALAAGGAVGSYILRGGDSSRLTTLNGRSDLWGVGIDALTGPLEWFHGLGFGATRVVFVDQFAFAGNAHNSVLGMLVGLGLVGVLLLLAAVVKAAVALARSGLVSDSPSGPTFVALLAYIIVSAITSDSLAEPHFGLAFLYLGTAVAIGWVGARDVPVPERRATTSSPSRSVGHGAVVRQPSER